MADAPLAATFRRPFDQQVAAWRARLGNLVPTARWDDIEREAHDRAFMVAGATKADLLADLAAAVDRAITEGTGIEAFRKDFRAIVEKNGWHGWTGEGTAKGEAWRTRVIYQTNMRVSMAAGRYAQLVDGGFEFWVYRHSGAQDPRPHHLAWDGLVLPADHPFWSKHYPPNGWGCGCKVRGARTERGARRVGGDPGKTLPEGWDSADPRTGAPPGVGRGWDYAPGASVADIVQTAGTKLASWPYDLGKAYITSLPTPQADAVAQAYRRLPSLAEDLRRYAERAVGERNGAPIAGPVIQQPYRTLGLLTSDQASRCAPILQADLSGVDYTVSSSAVLHVMKEHGDPGTEARRGQVAVTPELFRLLPQLLSDPDEALPGEGGNLMLRKRFGDLRVTAVFRLLGRRRMLSLVTMWISGAPRN